MNTTATQSTTWVDSPNVRVLPAGQFAPVHSAHDGVAVHCYGRPMTIDGTLLGAGTLAQRFAQDGARAIDAIAGHFALVVVDTPRAETRLYSDRFDTQRLFYSAFDGVLRVSSSLKALVNDLPVKPSISPPAILDYLFFHMIPSPRTIYEGVLTTEPAAQVCWDGQQAASSTYWKPRFTEQESRTDKEFADELFTLLGHVANDTASHHEKAGCFLSGGLDSSSLSGLMARHYQPLDAFSIGFPVEQYNEIDYARTAASHFGLNGHEYFMTPQDVLAALPKVAANMEQPFGNSSVIPAYFCAKLAKDNGIDHLIAGDGGDELFAGNERYAQQLKLERWHQALQPVSGTMQALFVDPPWTEKFKLTRKAASFSRQMTMPLPDRLEYFNFLKLMDRREMFSDTLLASLDLDSPEQSCRAVYSSLDDATPLSRMLYLDWKHTLADNDLVKVNTACAMAGVTTSYPLLDYRLVDFSLKVPSSIKLKPGKLRHLYKMAMTDFLPNKIINKSKHGFGLPFGIWTRDEPELRDMAYAALDSLKAYDLFQPAFIDEVKRQHQDVHAKHYGELVWVLMVLALWLDNQA